MANVALAAGSRSERLRKCFINIFGSTRVIFGLKSIVKTKSGELRISAIQRILAVLWCGLYVTSFFLSERLDIVLQLKIKNSLIVRILPKIGDVVSALALAFTYAETHAFAKVHKRTIEEGIKVFPQLDQEGIEHSKGNSVIVAIGLVQAVYCFYWYYIMAQVTIEQSSIFVFIARSMPKLVSACFFVDYAIGVVSVLQQFVLLNGELKELRGESAMSRHYPLDERTFQERIVNITDRHRKLTKIAMQLNQAHSFQLLFNISISYSFIVISSYISLYALISVFTEEAGNASLAFTSLLYLVLNAVTLVLIAEISTQLVKEVGDTNTLIKNL